MITGSRHHAGHQAEEDSYSITHLHYYSVLYTVRAYGLYRYGRVAAVHLTVLHLTCIADSSVLTLLTGPGGHRGRVPLSHSTPTIKLYG